MYFMQDQFTCLRCGAPLQGKQQKRFCSRGCGLMYWRERHPAPPRTVSPEGRRAISEAQKRRYADPANRPWGQRGGERTSHPASVRQERAARIQKDRPWERGGNGRPHSWRQERLAQALGWPSEYVVCTEGWWPPAYKIDVAEPTLKIAIEVGNVASPRKQAWYEANGWTYLHFSNRMVETWLEGCLATVASTTSRLQATTTTSPTASS